MLLELLLTILVLSPLLFIKEVEPVPYEYKKEDLHKIQKQMNGCDKIFKR